MLIGRESVSQSVVRDTLSLRNSFRLRAKEKASLPVAAIRSSIWLRDPRYFSFFVFCSRMLENGACGTRDNVRRGRKRGRNRRRNDEASVFYFHGAAVAAAKAEAANS